MSYSTKLQHNSFLTRVLDQLEGLTCNQAANSHGLNQARPGCLIELLDIENMSRANFELVMPDVADPTQNRISVLSPLGSHLLGLKKGDIARIKLWGRDCRFQILNIRACEAANSAIKALSP
jgi:transcription elongation GreA/GreB family factor